MRAVGSVGDKGDTIDRGRQFDPIGLLGDRGDGDLTAHAMTQGPDPPAIRRRFAVQPSSIIAVSAMIFAIVSVPIRRNIHANSGGSEGTRPMRHQRIVRWPLPARTASRAALSPRRSLPHRRHRCCCA